jgi:hypothetical protein
VALFLVSDGVPEVAERVRAVAATGRIAEIRHRYGSGHLVTRFITMATPDPLAGVSRTEQLMAPADR